MTDYTPTTEQVRSDYAETYEGTEPKRCERFDHWLAEERREAAEQAWDECVAVGYDHIREKNPYREGEKK